MLVCLHKQCARIVRAEAGFRLPVCRVQAFFTCQNGRTGSRFWELEKNRQPFCKNAHGGGNRMQWDDARIFLTVAREGSISSAAKRLGVQHSTVSRRIRALEQKLATPLVERKASGYVLTEAGEELKQSASRIENELLFSIRLAVKPKTSRGSCGSQQLPTWHRLC